MSSFFQQVLNGIKNQTEGSILRGLNAGMKYMREEERIFIWAVKTGNTEAIQECAAIAAQWMAETFTEAGEFLPQASHALTLALEGKSPDIDPWATSRHMTQALWEKWGDDAGFIHPGN